VLTRLAPNPQAPDDAKQPEARRQAQGIVRMVGAAARHGPCPAKCLPQSLTVWWLLRRQGVPSNLHIGVRRDGAELKAHAWVEHAGRVLNDHADVGRHFARFEQAIGPA
jgi:hypothetical protein